MSVSTTVASGQRPCNGATPEPPVDLPASAETSPTATAVILGSGRTHVWMAGRGALSCPSGGTVGTSRAPVCRGRVADGSGCVGVLSQLISQYCDPIPAGPVVVVCRPVLATMTEQYALRQVAATVFAPSRLARSSTPYARQPSVPAPQRIACSSPTSAPNSSTWRHYGTAE